MRQWAKPAPFEVEIKSSADKLINLQKIRRYIGDGVHTFPCQNVWSSDSMLLQQISTNRKQRRPWHLSKTIYSPFTLPMLFPLEFYFCVQVLDHVLFRLLEGLEALALHLWSHLLIHRHHIIRSFQHAFPTTLESTPGFSPSTMRTKLSNSDSPSFLSGPHLHRFHRLTIHHPFTHSFQA